MKKLQITSTEALDSAVAECVRLKIIHTKLTAERDAELTVVEKRHEATLQASAAEIAEAEAAIRDYCDANRHQLFAERKSRETSLAVFGFELTPHRSRRPTARSSGPTC
jgi:phage host-nuclease inhibitor protein Gam